MLRTNWLKIASIVCMLFYMVGCSQVTDPNAPSDATPLPADMTPMVPAQPPQGESTPVTPVIPSPASGSESLIEKAKMDLAQRLAVSATEINLVEAQSVTWPDSSLGCPQEGMMYTQVLTPGFLILLEHDSNIYEYHAGSRDSVTTCDNPSPPVRGMPGNT